MEIDISNSTDLTYSCSDGSGFSGNSVTVEYWDITSEPEKTHATITAALTLLLLALGLPGNLLIVIATVRLHLHKEPTYILLLNLTVSNFLTCVLVMPFTVAAGFVHGFKFGSNDKVRCALCQSQLVYSLFTTFSFHILVLLSVDRVIFIKYPFKYHRWVTRSRTTCVVLGLWVFCTLLSLLPVFGIGNFEFRHHIASCNVRLAGKWSRSKNLFYALALLAESVLLLAVLMGSNVWIICIVQQHLRRMYSVGRNRSDSDLRGKIKQELNRTQSKKQLHLIKVFVYTLVAHSVTWLPVMVRIIGTAVSGRDGFFPGQFYVFVAVSLMSFTVIHPVIIVAHIPEIRTAIARLLCVCVYHSRRCQTDGLHCQVDHVGKSCATGSAACKCLDFLSVAFLPVRDEFPTLATTVEQ